MIHAPLPSTPSRQPKPDASFWATYSWPRGGDEWSNPYGGTAAMWRSILMPRIGAFVPADHILEIAPGHGRCTQFLRPLCRHLTIVDIVPDCIEACRRRFDNDPAITFAVNDGRTLPMVPDTSIDFAFSWDSLVHVEESAVRSYVAELARCLRPGGVAFLHHSNLAQYRDQLEGLHETKDLHGRARDASAAALRDACRAAGLSCTAQELIPWGGTGLFIDAISVIQRTPAPIEPTITQHTGWRDEVANSRRIAELYRAP